MTTREKAVQEALSWLGTPYHHHARVKGSGVDCAQLLAGVFENIGMVSGVETGFYPFDWHLHHSAELFIEQLGKYAHRAPDGSNPEVGDVYLFRFGRTFSHGSIYVGDNSDRFPLFVHSYIGRGVILSGIHEEPLSGRDYQHWSIFQ